MKIIDQIKKQGLSYIVDKYKLKYKTYGHKFILKYDQINSYPFKGNEAVRECRGLVLSKNLDILCYPFKRFFNYEEVESDNIDFTKADVLKKEDGTLVTLYWDSHLNQWCTATTGQANGEGNVGDYDFTFCDLFWEVYSKYNGYNTELLDKRKNYSFELCTKYNQVVTFHEQSKLILLNVRNLGDLSEPNYTDLIEEGKKINIPAVGSYPLNCIEDIHELIKDMAADEEGFVAFDGKNRVKIKNPSYIIRHKLETNFNQKDIFTILKHNEGDEFSSVVSRYRELYNKAEHFWLFLLTEGYKLSQASKDLALKSKDKKDFAISFKEYINDWNKMYIHDCYKMMDEKLLNNNITSFDPYYILTEITNKNLNDLFNNFLNLKY